MDVDLSQSVFQSHCANLLGFLERQQHNIEQGERHLYRHQIDAVLNARQQLTNDQRSNYALVVLPTGCGKTGVAVLAAYALNAARVLVVTPSVNISDQIHKAFCSEDGFLLKRRIITQAQLDHVRPSGMCITNTSQIQPHRHDPLMVVNAHKIGGSSGVQIDTIPRDQYDLVIVDEAHHYPADTWRLLVDHFRDARKLFLTATPSYKGEPILPHDPCFSLNRDEAVRLDIIRSIAFCEDPGQGTPNKGVALLIKQFLSRHDREDGTVRHQAMVLAQTKEAPTINSAEDFKAEYDDNDDICQIYVGGTKKHILTRFNEGCFRTLVVVGRLREGYDNKKISVIGIVRNVSPKSKVLFAQFVGRAVRKAHDQDPVTTMVVSHPTFKQRQNFEQFDKVADEEDPEVDEE